MVQLREELIQGVIAEPLRIIEDERGAVLHMLRADSPLFKGFGEVYFSQVNPGIIKGWKRHRRMTQRFAVPTGKIKVVMHDDRDESATKGWTSEVTLGRPDAYLLLIIPPMVWYSFQGLSSTPAIMANCSDVPHDPGESEQMSLEGGSISYMWE